MRAQKTLPLSFVTLKSIRKALSNTRISSENEAELQSTIERALVREGINYRREYQLSKRDRPDFYLPQGEVGTAIEVKLKVSLQPLLRQIGRYLEHENVGGCIVIARRLPLLPSYMLDKPVLSIQIWEYLI